MKGLSSMNALALAGMTITTRAFVVDSQDIEFGNPWWFVYAGISCFLVLFAGIMSGLTLGLMSLGLVELEILQRSGTSTEKKQAAVILPVVQKQHQLLVTLLLCNAAAMEVRYIFIFPLFFSFLFFFFFFTISGACLMYVLGNNVLCSHRLGIKKRTHGKKWEINEEKNSTAIIQTRNSLALPIYLDKIFHPFVAIVLSVTFVLFFGEVIPQAICSRYGLAVGANFVWLVRILMIVCYPISYPIGKVLDAVLGHSDALFRRAQLKALVSIHGQEAGKGGELTHDETTIISGALDLTEKTAEEAMTPIESTFSLDVNSKLDWEAIGKILARGHSRVPVYSGNPKNIIGLLLVKSLLTVRAETETPVSSVSIRRMPRVPADMPLYDILNEFQKGSSHMAAVVKVKGKYINSQSPCEGDKAGETKVYTADLHLTTPLLHNKLDERSKSVVITLDHNGSPPQTTTGTTKYSPKENGFMSNNHPMHLSEDIEDGEVIGIITLEDVFEELLQEEIVDETDVYIDVHKRIRVAAAAAASSVARAPSSRRLTGPKPPLGGTGKRG